MTDDQHQHDASHATPDSPGALLRAAADDELAADDRARLDDLLAGRPGLSSGIDFERDLRAACGRVLGAVAAPAGLADRVRTAIADDALAAGLEDASPRTTDRGFWSRRALLSAAPAAVLLLAGALLFQASRVSRVPLDTDQLAYRQQLAGFLTEQHDKSCAGLVDAQQRDPLRFTEPTACEEAMTERLGRHVRVPLCDTSRAVYFAGGGPCGVPGQGPSGHFLYNADAAPDISVFVKQDNGELPLEPGRTYALNTRACGVPGSRILTRVDDGVLYFFVFNQGPGCQKALEALGVSAPSAEY
jgi:hypothetical protein